MQTNLTAFPKALNSAQETKYIKLMEKGDKSARNYLIEHNLRLVVHVCKKYENSKVDKEDLISIGTIGLIKGIDTYNSKKSIKISTYISKCIDNEILMYFRSIKKQTKEVFLEDSIGKDKDDNVILLKDTIEANDKSIDEKIDVKMKITKLEKKIKEVLNDRERAIVELRFGLNGNLPETQSVIAKKLNISRSYVSRIETKALEKLRTACNETFE